ncbi:MAG: TMEM175 family protein [Candidatus Omnitrophica bacterium]|nr:TMEM175 family protein [Candidatus Omnitrophota bacterium]
MQQDRFHITRDHIVSLVDGIFTCAMTLMFFSVNLPKGSENLTRAQLHKDLLNSLQNFANYLIVFFILILLWIRYHSRFHYIRHTDRKHLWINVMLCMSIIIIPFSTSLANDFIDDWLVQLIFSLNMLMIFLAFKVNWSYVTKSPGLIDANTITNGEIALIKKTGNYECFIAILAVTTAFIYPSFTVYVFILMPLAAFIAARTSVRK